ARRLCESGCANRAGAFGRGRSRAGRHAPDPSGRARTADSRRYGGPTRGRSVLRATRGWRGIRREPLLRSWRGYGLSMHRGRTRERFMGAAPPSPRERRENSPEKRLRQGASGRIGPANPGPFTGPHGPARPVRMESGRQMKLGDFARNRLHILPSIAALLALLAAPQVSLAAAPQAATQATESSAEAPAADARS